MKFCQVLFLPFLIALVVFSSCDSSDDPAADEEEVEEIIEEETELELYSANVTAGMPGISDARDITSFELLEEMGPGWNLGNSFDVMSRDKTEWGNPLPNENIINAVKSKGFRTLRIPITWEWNQSSQAPYQIELDFLEQIQEVVDFGLANQMHVIINVHHDNDWAKPAASSEETANARLGSLWTQVATYFMAYNDSLIFELLNEPRVEGIPEEWTGGTEEGRTILNGFLKTGVDAIRATGGNNSLRHIMTPTWAASTQISAMNGLVIPNDDPKIIVSLHTYWPYNFTLNNADGATYTWGSEAEVAALVNEFDWIRQKWIEENNRPVILGEWAVRKDRDVSERVNYMTTYAKEASSRDLLTILWDDGGDIGSLDRWNLFWESNTVIDAIIDNSAPIDF